MSLSDAELQKMIRSFRVADLQTLLQYAGRNKVGKKTELQLRAFELLKSRSQSIEMKIREIHTYRFTQPRSHTEMQDMQHPLGAVNELPGMNYGSRTAHQSMYAMPSRSLSSRNSSMLIPRNPMSSRTPMPASFTDMMSTKVKAPNLGMPVDLYNQYPLSPDLKFKVLPFYDVLAQLIKPTSLIVMPSERFREREFSFCFTPQQLNHLVRNQDVQIQMRMCLLDVASEQEDEIPPDICLKVNNRVIGLPSPIPTNRPGVEPKRPKRPIDITSAIKQSDTEINSIQISWANSNGKPHVFAVYLVQKLSSSTLIRRLKENGVRNPDHTTAVIKEKLSQDRDSEIATMSLRGSLMCPLGKIKMVLPCRALTCSHLQCFDGTLYLQMNEKKPKWICPVCDKQANFKDLAIDGLFLDIISKAPSECNEVQFHEDGSWTPVMPIVKKTPQVSETVVNTPPKVTAPKPKRSVEVIDLDTDSDTEDSWHLISPPHKKTHVQSDPDSPIIIEPSSNPSGNSGSKELESFNPCSPKSHSPTFPPIGSIKKQEPVTLDLDSDVDCIETIPPASFSNFETTAPSDPSTSAFQETKAPTNGEDAPTTRQYSDFNFFSLIENPEESLDSATITDNEELEVIDLEDDDDD